MFDTVAVNCLVSPAATVALVGEIATDTGCVMVTVEDADFVVSAFEVAVTVTVAGLGTAEGAVYRPLLEIVPQVAPEQPLPLRLQLTAVLDMPVTVAVNCCVLPTTTVAVIGETLTPTAGRMVTLAEAVFVESAFDFAVMVTRAGLGRVPGAV